MRASTTKLISSTHPTLHLSHPTIESYTWNSLIRSKSQFSSPQFPPISVFLRMLRHSVRPDSHTFPFLLQSFNNPTHLNLGRIIHAQIVRFGLCCDAFVGTSLVNMYSACGGEIGLAQQVFDEMPQRDLPAWNSVINANLQLGRLESAGKLFDEMHERNVISWSCMINGYVKWGDYKEALVLFREMQKCDDVITPNEFTMSGVLAACGRLGALEHGKWAHAYIDKSGLKVDVVLGTALVDMYARCGALERARSVFDGLGRGKDVKAWTVMISALALHGHGKECLELFSRMLAHGGINPNAVTFLGVLCACVHSGLVTDGENYFRMMIEEFGIFPSIQHYGCMVDLYARAGLIEKAWDVINSMPMEPDVLIWGALLSGSRMHGNIETCEVALKKLIQLEPTNSGAYVLISNVYARMRRWKDARHIRSMMEAHGVKKVPGCSLVEIGGVIHEFFAGDESHGDEVYLMLEEVMRRLKMEGYVVNTEEVLLDLEDEEAKEISVSRHSEKLAVAFALLKTRAGTPIRVVKNLRICVDCHEAIRVVSRVYNREIVVRDCNRFHHFRDGECSCKGYW